MKITAINTRINEILSTIVDENKLFNLYVPEDVPTPFCCYKRNDCQEEYEYKDDITLNATFEILWVDDDYKKGLQKIEDIATILQRCNCDFVGLSEFYIENKFVQRLTISTEMI